MLLDTTAIITAADLIERETGNGCFLHGKRPRFPVRTQQQSGLPGFLRAWETPETDFRGGWGEAMELHPGYANREPTSPAPPGMSMERAQPESLNTIVSLVSQEREPQCQQGLTGDFCGKHHGFPLLPTFPAGHLDDYAIQERAAILEYDGGMTRAEAEAAVGLI